MNSTIIVTLFPTNLFRELVNSWEECARSLCFGQTNFIRTKRSEMAFSIIKTFFPSPWALSVLSNLQKAPSLNRMCSLSWHTETTHSNQDSWGTGKNWPCSKLVSTQSNLYRLIHFYMNKIRDNYSIK